MSVVIFEDDRWADFYPFSSTRHVGQQILGTESIIDQVAGRVDDPVTLAGRSYMAEMAKEETGLGYNEKSDGSVLVINGRINPLLDFETMTAGRSDFALVCRGEVAMALLTKRKYEGAISADGTLPQKKLLSLSKGLEVLETEEPLLFAYPWEMLAVNDRAIEAKGGKKGGKLSISPKADVDEFVSFDPSKGPIIVGDEARIESFSRIAGPCYIGPKTVVHSALVRGGTTIGENCRIGGEVENSIVYPHTNKAHLGYLGHSIVGEWVNLGAGSVTSDLKSTYGTVRVARDSGRVDTGLQKLGPMIADMAKVAIGALVYGGKSVGVSAHCAGRVDHDIPDFTSYDGHRDDSFELTLDSVIRTQSRMMERRGLKLSGPRRGLIERLYSERGGGGADTGEGR
jgi:UDP-N-acetylglucosamine diphosphorylase / glucose-1-phosphate thymidylyltransferase / UDP-N-acetylgalactosamine diphosphorylase / glucosamine-1-phosphate N-acetyltransferase / galactosamine-1-phosphate N-acetyltransferase